MGNAIEIRGITKLYRIYDRPSDRLRELLSVSKKKRHREFTALSDVSLDIVPGEMLGIIGRNGSGKSTLLKIICGVLSPTSGTVVTKGRISALLELGTGFNPEFTGRENAYFNGTLMGFSEMEMDARIAAIEEFADIGRFIDQPVKKYSSGMYVRLAFACAINVDPDILIIDEALAVGDVFFQHKCYRKISEFKEYGKTIILVSHSMGSIQNHCDRAVMIEDGLVAAEGEPRVVINKYLEKLSSPDTARQERGSSSGRQQDMPRDMCPARTGYNPNEYRYGSGDAVITDFGIYTETGEPALSILCGDMFIFRYDVQFLKRAEDPIYGFSVKTVDGFNIYTTSTLHDNIKVAPKGPGDAVVVEFRQRAWMSSGEYFLTAGIAIMDGENPVSLDRRSDMALLRVMPVGRSFGVANLMSGITVRPANVDGGGM
jgi:teichoic acid transport system ATP-binding protein